jgi:hypothetical protein
MENPEHAVIHLRRATEYTPRADQDNESPGNNGDGSVQIGARKLSLSDHVIHAEVLKWTSGSR